MRGSGKRVAAACALLLAGNATAWLWAWAAFHGHSVLLGTAVLAYSLGLRHGFDADHIAAIDNATRKLLQEGRRPIAAGLFFALGHSTVVVALSVAVALSAAAVEVRFALLRSLGGAIGTVGSTLFLFAIAAANLAVLTQISRDIAVAAAGETDGAVDGTAAGVCGPLARVFQPAFRLVRRSWHMYPVGMLFGLGFDTATEIGLLGIAAQQATRGLPLASILVLPALFTAGMTLVDMTDSILMVGAYGWALVRPRRKLWYNLTITLLSAAAALFLGSFGALGLVGDTLALRGGLWQAIDSLGDHYGTLGGGLVAFFVLSWLVSVLLFKVGGGAGLRLPLRR